MLMAISAGSSAPIAMPMGQRNRERSALDPRAARIFWAFFAEPSIPT
ncbi:MAG: hypothetical protein U0166_14095 [Acidobacteriota bacterium]